MRRRLFGAFALLFVFLSACSIDNAISRKQLLNYEWKFNLGDNAEASSADFNDSNWRKLDLPHDWSVEGKTDINNPTKGGGGYFPAGIGWYRKSLSIPENYADKNISIYFEGAYMNSTVYVNGKEVGVQPYGYSSFYFDITPHVLFGGENIIAVRVDNSQQPNCRWYSGSGIYRNVWLTVTDKIHVKQWGVAITTPEVSPDEAKVVINSTLVNSTSESQMVILSTKLATLNAEHVGDGNIEVELEANSQKTVKQELIISNPELWSPENPNLYRANIEIIKDDKVLDGVTEKFGVRTIAYSADKGFQLNGETILINGGCVHHDNGCLGAAAYDRAEERKVELLKEAGFNAVRTSHNPPSVAFLDACDRLGLLVIDESFDGWKAKKTDHDYAKIFDEWWQHDVKSMVLRDRNHPSIVMWSIGNEIIERTSPEAVVTAKMLSNFVKSIDTTRPVTSAMTSWNEGWEIFDPLMAEHDICGYNYMLHEAPKDHERVPSRVILQTESYPRDAFYCWNMVNEHSYVIGDFVWTAMDYLGESGIGRYYYPGERGGQHWEGDHFPWHGAYCGDIDLLGWRKPISHYRDMLYNNTEKIYMAVKEPNPAEGEIKETMWSVWPTWESWTWPGYEGKDIEVEVYSKYPKVRLYHNDKLVGELPTTKEQEFKATFKVPYEAGIIKAVAVDGDVEKESVFIQTAEEAKHIRLLADRTELNADGQDLSFVTVEITDNDGVIQPHAAHQLKFKVEGAGEIVGVDNANLQDEDLYVSDSRKAWKGRAMVVVKSAREAGEINITVSAEGLEPASIQLSSK